MRLSLGGAARWAALVFLFLAAAVSGPAFADPTFPPLTGRVVDEADILPPADEAALTAKLEALEARTTDQVVVATVPSLQGYAIEEFGYKLGRHWQIGQKGANNGIVLLVAPNDRKVRIEVGYGLEGVMTDAYSTRIIQQDILPHFRDGDFPGGVNAGVDRIIEQLTADPADAKARADKAAQAPRDLDPDTVIFIIVMLLVFGPHVLVLLGLMGLFGKRGRSWARSSHSWSSGSSSGSSWSSSSSSGGGFSGGGGSFGGGGSSGGW
ncbi:MAG: TPM domain-containing protein [Caulobacteraceae bacterium]|nr:TPM domain-containing protein [Caulobacteraceae bacterium]